jgi:tetratricopeptide (TPR) repeat protein
MVVMMEQAREALRLAEGDPNRSIALASEVVTRAGQAGDVATAAVAQRAWGLAAVHLEDLDSAVRHLRMAVGLGKRAGAPRLAAEAQMTLAYALNARGRTRRALLEIESALGHLDGLARARAQAQRAAILQQVRRFDEAIAIYRNVLPVLRRADDLLWVQRVLSNRGIVHTYRYEFAAAEADQQEAVRVCEKLGLDLSMAWVQQNLGFLNAIRGDVPAALRYLDLAEERFRALGAQVGEVLADRSQLLLSVRLVSEAREVAEQAVAEFEHERRRFTLPEARLFLAEAAMLDGDPARALREGRRAVREFLRQERDQWAQLARFAVLSSRLAGAHRARVRVHELERAAEMLTGSGWPAAAIEARLHAARLALERGQAGRARRQLHQASRGRLHGPAALRARAWYAEALLRFSTGRRRGAARAVGAGLRILDEYRATFGATDLRAHVSGHRTELAELGLRLALQGGRARRVLVWVERGRASHLLSRPVRPPDDPVVARALAELRVTVADIEDARRAGRPVSRLVQRQVAVEAAIRDHHRRQQGDGALDLDEPLALDSLDDALGEAALVEFFQLDGTLRAVVVVDGRVRLRRLGPVLGLEDLVDRLRFALHRLASRLASPASRAAAIAMLRHAAARLDAALLGPLADLIHDRPLVLVPTGPLQSLPWSTLSSCAGRPITLAPSTAIWLAASRRPLPPVGHVVVAAAPDLPGARAEAGAIATIYPRSTALLGSAATVERVMTAMNGAGLAHLAAHGYIRADSPLFSALRLADGPLTLYDLERLDRVPHTMVLAACDSARSIVRPGDELLGFSATFLSRDCRQLVASVAPIPDASTAPLMVALHRLLATGRPVAGALAQAQQEVAGEETAMAAAAGFVCIGAGFAAPVRAPLPPAEGRSFDLTVTSPGELGLSRSG